MEPHAASLGLSFLAGLLSMLSPCVLPLLPILVASALLRHRFGPIALAAGLASSFAIAGTAFAFLGQGLGIDQDLLRQGAAVLLVLLGLVMLSRRLQASFAATTRHLGMSGEALANRIEIDGFFGQFALGSVLGLAWTPCVGPTLGSAILFASQGRKLAEGLLMMSAFGIGAAIPLVVAGRVSRTWGARKSASVAKIGWFGRSVFGAMTAMVGLAMLSGVDKWMESRLLEWSPDWLVAITTSI